MRYNRNDIPYIIEAYKNHGGDFCCKKYNIGKWSLYDILQKSNIKTTGKCFNRKYRDQKYLNVNGDDFIEIKTKYHAYILGLLWADGWIIYKKKNKSIRIELTYEDAKIVESIFDKTGKWNKYYIEKNSFRKKRMGFVASSAKFADFLFENDYKYKSLKTPEKIYSKIPEKYKKYFLLGWSDGDGCFYFNVKTNRIEYTVAGSYEQDWSLLEKIFRENGITNYRVKRKIMKNGNKYSIIRILAGDQIKLLKNILYTDGFTFGLKRKFEKLEKIINIIEHGLNVNHQN